MFGDEVRPPGARRVAEYPTDLWHTYDDSQPGVRVVRQCLERNRKIEQVSYHDGSSTRFQVHNLTNLNEIEYEHVRTEYRLTESRRNYLAMYLVELKARDNYELINQRRDYDNASKIVYDDEDLQEQHEQDMITIDKKIENLWLEICLSGIAEWIKMNKVESQYQLRNAVCELRRYVLLCQELNIQMIIRNRDFDCGNCVVCFRKGRLRTRCVRSECRENMYAQVEAFMNLRGHYINPDLIHIALSNERRLTDIPNISEVNNEAAEHEYTIIVLPLEINEFFETTFACEFKLLWYAQMYGDDEDHHLRRVMNEVVTTYEVMSELYHVYTRVVRYEKYTRPMLWLRDQVLHGRYYMNAIKVINNSWDGIRSATGMIAIQAATNERSVPQQEHDGENANLVHGDNNDAPNNDAPDNNAENDAHRARDEESHEEERNVRPRLVWGVLQE